MKKMISFVIAVIATVSSAIAVPQTAAVDTTQAAKQAKKALKLMNKDNEKDCLHGGRMLVHSRRHCADCRLSEDDQSAGGGSQRCARSAERTLRSS